MNNEHNPAEVAMLLILQQLQRGYAQTKDLESRMGKGIQKSYAQGKLNAYQEMIGKVTQVTREYEQAKEADVA